jgi:hypothetical protein
LKRNKTLIQADQREYQKDLENKFTKFTESLQPLLAACRQSTIIESTLANNKRYSLNIIRNIVNRLFIQIISETNVNIN